MMEAPAAQALGKGKEDRDEREGGEEVGRPHRAWPAVSCGARDAGDGAAA